MRMRRPWILGAIVICVAAVWMTTRGGASHDPRLVGVWQDNRLEAMRRAARDRGPVQGQGSWLVLGANGEGRQVDFNPITLRSETRFNWRSEAVDGRSHFFRSYRSAGALGGEAGRSGEVRYTWERSSDGRTLSLKGAYGNGVAYQRLTELPERVRAAPEGSYESQRRN
jgi:hypothetical protein